jgi:hypothetical protein
MNADTMNDEQQEIFGIEIFVDQFTNKKCVDREHSEDFLLLIVHSVSIHLLKNAFCR